LKHTDEVIEHIGPFGAPFDHSGSYVTRSSIDFSRLIVALLAVNFLPAVILWRSEVIGEWLRRHKRKLVISACLLFLLLLLFIGGALFYEKAHRVPPTRSSLDKQSSVRSASPSPAPPSGPASPSPSQDSISRPAFSNLPAGATVVSTPSPAPSPSSDFDWSSAMIEYSPGSGRIKSKSDDGETITLEDGSVWRVDPPDRIHTASWTRMTYLDVVISEIGYRDRKRGYLLINPRKAKKPMRNGSALHSQNRGIYIGGRLAFESAPFASKVASRLYHKLLSSWGWARCGMARRVTLNRSLHLDRHLR
jgi:hypothetical protein